MILRLIYMVWIIGAIVVLARGLSQILFGGGGANFATFMRTLLLSALWPVALMTVSGRAALKGLTRRD